MVSDNDKILGRRLTARYALALALVAAVLIVNYVVAQQKLAAEQTNAYVLNISGMQRMLSQRIALMGSTIEHSTDRHAALGYADTMRAATARMAQNHEELASGIANGSAYPMSPALKDLYFAPGGVDDSVRSFLAHANQFADLFFSRDLAAVQASESGLEPYNRRLDELLEKLDAVVSQYQSDSEARLERLAGLERGFLFFGLAMLALEVVFIFRPAVARVVSKTRALEQSNAELRELTYRLSHDLKAPILSCSGLLTLVTTSKDPDERAQALEYIKSSLEQLETLLEDILSLTRSKLAPGRTEAVHLAELIDEVTARSQHLPNFSRIAFTTEVTQTAPISARKVLLAQTLDNLVSNAVKYQDPRQEHPRIHIHARQTATATVISIEDNGIGIPERSREKLFEMFQRFHPNVSFGSGLGLYLVRQNIVEGLGGSIRFRPLTPGSAFDVTLPVRKSD